LRQTSALNLTLARVCSARSWSSREIRWRSRTTASDAALRSAFVCRGFLSKIHQQRFKLNTRDRVIGFGLSLPGSSCLNHSILRNDMATKFPASRQRTLGLKRRIARQVPAQKLQSSRPRSLVSVAAIALPRIVHKGMAGVWIRIKLVCFVKSLELNLQLVHILR
jgi:hypothetical protein